MRELVLVLALALTACAQVPKPSIESALEQVRAACALLGHTDLDACAADVGRKR